MKIMFVGDVHLADRPPSVRTDTYREDILDKLDWVVERSNDEEVDAIVQLGDPFHIKSPSRNSHYLVQRTARIFEKSKSPVRIVAGNHDVGNDRIEDLDRQPLGTVALHPNVHLLSGLDQEFPIYGIPYFDLTTENLNIWADRYHSEAGPSKAPFIITHNSLFPQAQGPLYDYVSYEEWAGVFKNKFTAYGHIHTQVRGGPHYKLGDQWFINEGSLSRGSLHESSLTRQPSVALYDSDVPEGENPFTSLSVPHKPAAEVFKLEVAQIEKDRKNSVETFLKSLGSTELQYLTVEGILEDAKQNKELPKDAVVELEDIITNVTGD